MSLSQQFAHGCPITAQSIGGVCNCEAALVTLLLVIIARGEVEFGPSADRSSRHSCASRLHDGLRFGTLPHLSGNRREAIGVNWSKAFFHYLGRAINCTNRHD